MFIWPVFYISKEITNSINIALLTCVLTVVSIDTVSTGVWLSNPFLLLISVPLFYLLLYKVFWKNQLKWLVPLALSLGVSNQAAISSIYLFIPLLLGFIYAARNKKGVSWLPKKKLLIFLVTYLLSISTMIITQVKMFVDGSFNLEIIQNLASSNSNPVSVTLPVILLYVKKIKSALFPNMPLLATVIFLIALIFLLRRLSSAKRVFILIWLLSNGSFLLIRYRSDIHSLIGLTPIIILAFSYLTWFILTKSRFWAKILCLLVLIIFFGNHLGQLLHQRRTHHYIHGVQKGYLLTDQLQLIDYTYSQALGEPFSISTATIPYGWNTTWAYLYSWYGNKHYNYTPTLFGPSQEGIFGQELLDVQMNPEKIHFAIYEPDVLLLTNQKAIKDFQASQKKYWKTDGREILFQNNN